MTTATAPINGAEPEQAAIVAQDGDDNVTLFPTPAPLSQTRLAEELRKARERRIAEQQADARYKDHLADTVFGAENQSRDRIADDVDAILGAANMSSVARDLQQQALNARMEQAEMARKIADFIGTDAIKLVDDGKLDQAISQIVADNAALLEAGRRLCQSAGTVRVDEVAAYYDENERFRIQRRFVDIGDEEPGQDPLVNTKWMVTALLKASVRFESLLSEATQASARAHRAEASAASTSAELAAIKAKYNAQTVHYQRLLREDAERGDEATYAPPRIVVTNGTEYMRLRPGHDPRVAWAYGFTRNPSRALQFDSVEQAKAILHKVSVARFRNIPLEMLDTMSVSRIVTEDHGVIGANDSPIVPHYPAAIPAAPKAGKAVTAPKATGGTVAYDVSVRDDVAETPKKAAKSKLAALGKRAKLAIPKRPPQVPANAKNHTKEGRASMAARLVAARARAKG